MESCEHKIQMNLLYLKTVNGLNVTFEMKKDFENSATLLDRLKELDLDAFNYLYTTSREKLYAYAYFIIKDETVAQDLVQDLFVDFWERQLFRNIDTSLISYLMRSVRNRSYDYLNKQNTQKKLKDQFDYLKSDDHTINNKLENAELGKKIKDALSHLSPMQGKVFYYHYIQQLSYAQVADLLNISKSTISTHMDKALKTLRFKLK